jgi:hypothetical protein
MMNFPVNFALNSHNGEVIVEKKTVNLVIQSLLRVWAKNYGPGEGLKILKLELVLHQLIDIVPSCLILKIRDSGRIREYTTSTGNKTQFKTIYVIRSLQNTLTQPILITKTLAMLEKGYFSWKEPS